VSCIPFRYNEYRVALLVTVTNKLADILTARKYVLSQHNTFRENPTKKHKIFDFLLRVMYNNLIKILHVEYYWLVGNNFHQNTRRDKLYSVYYNKLGEREYIIMHEK
jgi:hypothetical protein